MCWPPTPPKLHEKVAPRQIGVGRSVIPDDASALTWAHHATQGGSLAGSAFVFHSHLFHLLCSLPSNLPSAPWLSLRADLPPATPSSSLTVPRESPSLQAFVPSSSPPLLSGWWEEVSFLQDKMNPPLHCGAQPLCPFQEPSLNHYPPSLSSVSNCPFFTGLFPSALKCT